MIDDFERRTRSVQEGGHGEHGKHHTQELTQSRVEGIDHLDTESNISDDNVLMTTRRQDEHNPMEDSMKSADGERPLMF